MRRQKHRRSDSPRLAIDSSNEHADLKTIAAQDGLGKDKFKMLLKEIIEEDDAILRRLADK